MSAMSQSEQPDDSQADEVAHSADALAVMPAMGSMANTEAARAIAEVQASMLLARRFPRDENKAMERIESSCSRLSLAQKATYVYTRGGEEISGPTIRLAEAVVQGWGNMRAGVEELSRDYSEGISVCRAYAVDQETGTGDEKKFFVRHWREIRGSKGYRVESDRDIRELVANYGARSKRACIEAVVPKHVFEDAVDWCELTLHDNVRTDAEALESMLKKFSALGVEQVHIEERINRALAEILPAQMIKLHKIYNSLKGSDSAPSDWFSIVDANDSGTSDQPKTIASIIARGESRVAAKKGAVKTAAGDDPLAADLLQAKTLDQLNAITVKFGPIKDFDRKDRLYKLAEEQAERIKALKASK